MNNLPAVTLTGIGHGLRILGIGPADTVMVHSSLSAFGWVDGGARTVIEALLEAVGTSGTLVMPTFTWHEKHARERVTFDVQRTPCETGRIPEFFRTRPNVIRSVHVCHSVAATGPAAEEMMGEGSSSFAPGSTFDALLKRNAWILMLGVSFQACTALHAVEEFVGVPYRRHRHFQGSVVILPDGRRLASCSIEYLRRDRSSNDFAKMDGIFRKEGVLRETRIGRADCMAVRMADIFTVTRPLLERHTNFLSS